MREVGWGARGACEHPGSTIRGRILLEARQVQTEIPHLGLPSESGRSMTSNSLAATGSRAMISERSRPAAGPRVKWAPRGDARRVGADKDGGESRNAVEHERDFPN